MEPDEGFAFFEGRTVEHVVLSNRHHYRHADRFAAHFGIPVHGVEEGMHEIGDRPGVEAFAFGSSPAPGITVHPIEPTWPDEGAVHIAVGDGFLLLGDSTMHYGAEIGFIPDEHLGGNPDEVKAMLRADLAKLLDLEFDSLLFSHGAPIVGGGKDALRAFVEA